MPSQWYGLQRQRHTSHNFLQHRGLSSLHQ